jgi:hypothetical protein
VAPCPATSLLAGARAGDPDATLGLIRRFRDEVLARSETGRALIEAYYRDGSEVDRLMLAQPGLRWRTARLLLGSPPLLRQALETGGVTLDRQSWADLGGLITEFERSGSAELKGDLSRLRADVQARATTTPEGSVRLAFRD